LNTDSLADGRKVWNLVVGISSEFKLILIIQYVQFRFDLLMC